MPHRRRVPSAVELVQILTSGGSIPYKFDPRRRRAHARREQRVRGRPQPRPVWGIWADEWLNLSIGSPAISRLLEGQPEITVHLDSGTDVVVLEGVVAGRTDDPVLIRAYNDKYDGTYTKHEYGPLTRIRPTVALAWRAAGWAGRDGFRQGGRWRFVDHP